MPHPAPPAINLGMPGERIIPEDAAYVAMWVCRLRDDMALAAFHPTRGPNYVRVVAFHVTEKDLRDCIDSVSLVADADADCWLQAIGIIKHFADTYGSNPSTKESTTHEQHQRELT